MSVLTPPGWPFVVNRVRNPEFQTQTNKRRGGASPPPPPPPGTAGQPIGLLLTLTKAS